MKNFMFPTAKVILLFFANCLIAVTVISLTGCQENSITDSVNNESVNKDQTGTSDTYFQGIIRLEGVLDDPYPVGNSFYRIIGQIEFEQQHVFNYPLIISSQRFAFIHFITNAELMHVCTVCSPSAEDEISGFVSEISEDKVLLAGSSVSLLEKTYLIQGREDGMMLKIRFIVSFSGVELSAMWLALPETNAIATVKNY